MTSDDDYECDIIKPHDPHPVHGVGDLQPHHYAWILSGACAFVSVAISLRLIFQHLRHYHQPALQRHIVRILFMVPVYSIVSWLSFRFYQQSVYLDTVRDCYEALVIWEFYALLVEYLGGENEAPLVFDKKQRQPLPVPLCCCHVNPRRNHVLPKCKVGILQYVWIRPLMTIAAVVMQLMHMYCSGNLNPRWGYFHTSLINLLSASIAVYFLLLFYILAREELAPFNPVIKFVSIKFVIFFSFWQSLVVGFMIQSKVIRDTAYWSSDNIGTGIQNFLICLEMVVAAIMHLRAFHYGEFTTTGDQMETKTWRSLMDIWDFSDVWKHSVRSLTIPDDDEFEPPHIVMLESASLLPGRR
eukprot:TRINITY_DN6346_c0_g1_i1.p1 TRINITY_DN6346_c0_g1~~TRINITY_DN6346_c0_g1_i1.p1  ORF type:complete len:390 (+),score=51.37 TRINITY_DN6346_c0_g1_i1:104-1171(+)